MRVKISYTAEVEEVREEAAYLINNLGTTINQSIELFNNIVANLKEEKFNSTEWYGYSQRLRKNLARLDTRLVEVEQIVLGLEDYERGRLGRQEDPPPLPDLTDLKELLHQQENLDQDENLDD